MTPDQARALLDGTTPGPWEVDYDGAWEPGVWSPDIIVFGPYYDREDMDQWEAGSAADLRLTAAAPDLARTIAGMTTEHRHEVQSIADGTWHPLTEWAEGEPDRRPWNITPTRIVRRYVTESEEI